MRAATDAQPPAAGADYPLVLHGASIEALVVGAGRVATRKAAALLEAGARVRIVAPHVGAECASLVAAHADRASIERREYRAGDIGDALLVIAATSNPSVNAAVARDAAACHRLVNVADDATRGNCSVPAVHRAGPLTIAVSAGGVPGAAARVRDAIGERFDGRYGDALAAIGRVRERLLGEQRRDAWRTAADELAGPDFCAAVEAGTIGDRVARWR